MAIEELKAKSPHIELVRQFIAHDVLRPIRIVAGEIEECERRLSTSPSGSSSKERRALKSRTEGVSRVRKIFATVYDEGIVKELLDSLEDNSENEREGLNKCHEFLNILSANLDDCLDRLSRSGRRSDGSNTVLPDFMVALSSLKSLRDGTKALQKLFRNKLDMTAPVNLSRLLWSVVGVGLTPKMAEMVFRFGPNSMNAEAEVNHHYLRFVINQILSNSLRHSRSPVTQIEIRINICSEPPRIFIDQLPVDTVGDWILLEFRDAGEGVHHTTLEQLRAVLRDDTTSQLRPVDGFDPRRGSGVGLQICRRVVRTFGGRIDLESVYGSGTTVYVLLPRASGRRATP